MSYRDNEGTNATELSNLIGNVREYVDDALVDAGTDPDLKNELPPEDCASSKDVAGKLQCFLEIYVNFPTSLERSRGGSGEHWYLVIREFTEELIIDPTISRIIIGYEGTFIGTRRMLKELLRNHTGPTKRYKFSAKWNWSGNNWDEEEQDFWFECIWGETSTPEDLEL